MLKGSILKERRRMLGLSQGELGKKAGLIPQAISQLERGVQPDVRSSTLTRLADALGCTTDYLLGRTRRRAA